MRPPCMVLHKGPTKKNNILKTENLLIPYTHANNSSRVCMWGFAKKNCSLSLDGGFFLYYRTRGFDDENFYSINNAFDKFLY